MHGAGHEGHIFRWHAEIAHTVHKRAQLARTGNERDVKDTSAAGSLRAKFDQARRAKEQVAEERNALAKEMEAQEDLKKKGKKKRKGGKNGKVKSSTQAQGLSLNQPAKCEQALKEGGQ